MKLRACLLAFVLLCSLPGRALAHSHRMWSFDQYSTACGIRLPDDDRPVSPPVQCASGVAVKVGWYGMKVRAAHGSLLQVRFSDDTLFETDSGEGVLDGLVSGDYVCVGYVRHTGGALALLVLFDPVIPPCHVAKHRDLVDATPGTCWKLNIGISAPLAGSGFMRWRGGERPPFSLEGEARG